MFKTNRRLTNIENRLFNDSRDTDCRSQRNAEREQLQEARIAKLEKQVKKLKKIVKEGY